jgi:hypothetical protein
MIITPFSYWLSDREAVRGTDGLLGKEERNLQKRRRQGEWRERK